MLSLVLTVHLKKDPSDGTGPVLKANGGEEVRFGPVPVTHDDGGEEVLTSLPWSPSRRWRTRNTVDPGGPQARHIVNDQLGLDSMKCPPVDDGDPGTVEASKL